jgi:hypothetical protein
MVISSLLTDAIFVVRWRPDGVHGTPYSLLVPSSIPTSKCILSAESGRYRYPLKFQRFSSIDGSNYSAVRSFQLCVYVIANISLHVLRQLCASDLEETHPTMISQ